METQLSPALNLNPKKMKHQVKMVMLTLQILKQAKMRKEREPKQHLQVLLLQTKALSVSSTKNSLSKITAKKLGFKETLAQVFSCEFCEISKNTFFTKQLWATASGFSVLNCFFTIVLTHLRLIFPSCRNQSIDLL